jgi:hypothetical protein
MENKNDQALSEIKKEFEPENDDKKMVERTIRQEIDTVDYMDEN